MNENVTFGQKVKELRKQKGITLKQLSDLTGLRIESLSHYENDKVKPFLVNVNKIAIALDYSFEDLCNYL